MALQLQDWSRIIHAQGRVFREGRFPSGWYRRDAFTSTWKYLRDETAAHAVRSERW
jgi:hypothetical protein